VLYPLERPHWGALLSAQQFAVVALKDPNVQVVDKRRDVV
jgi:hypothetical protein